MLRLPSSILTLLALSVASSAHAAVCFDTDKEGNSATLYLYDAGGKYCPEGYGEHDGVALTCKRHGEMYTELQAELYLFAKTKVGELWVANKPLSIKFRQGMKIFAWEEEAISLQRDDYLGDYVYLIHSPSGLPRALAEMLISGQDIQVEVPGGSSFIFPMKDEASNGRKFVEFCAKVKS